MNTLKLNKYKTHNHPSQTKNYSTLFFAVSKPWPSGFERRLKKYGWFSSGCTKQVINPELNHISTPELNHHSLQDRRSRPLAQALPILNGRWYSSSQKHAFTIIEVVLVLAIADLIFLMVFIALPALQRSQRNTGYKNNVAIAGNILQNYRANNRGQFPESVDSATGNVWGFNVGADTNSGHPLYSYIQNSGITEGTNVKNRNIPSNTTGTADHNTTHVYGRIVIYTNAKCTTGSIAYSRSSTFYEYSVGHAIVWTILEEGLEGLIYCQDVQ